MSAFHLAQTNLGRTTAPLDSLQLRPFMDALMEVNANADAAPGFVWRLQTEERYAYLREHGPTPYAFGFQHHFPPPDAGTAEATVDDADLCPA